MYAILALLAAAGPATPPAAPPALTAARAVVDAGEVRTGRPLTHTFTVTNPGPAAVTVVGVTTPCGCIAPAVSRPVLAAGESATVTLAVNTLTQSAGRQTWRGAVRYATGPTPHELPWELSATLVREVSVTPPAVALSGAADVAVTLTLTVSDVRPKPLTVRAALVTSPHLTAAAGPAVGGSTPVTLTLLPTHPAGTADETLVLHTDDPACPELRVPVKVTRRAAQVVIVTPAAPSVRLSPSQADGSVLVQLRSPTRGPVRVEGVTSDHPAVTAKWASAAGVGVTVRIVIAPRPADGIAGTATLTVTLAEPKGETATVPVTWSRPTP